MRKKIRILSAMLVAAGLSAQALAANSSANWNITGEVVGTCTVSATDVALGQGTATTATSSLAGNSTLTVRCSQGLSYSVAPDGSSTGWVENPTGLAAGRYKTPTLSRYTGSDANGKVFLSFKESSGGTDWTDLTPITGAGIAADQTYTINVKADIDSFIGSFNSTMNTVVTW